MSLNTFNIIIGIGTLGIAFITIALIIFKVMIGKHSHIMNLVQREALIIGAILGLSAIVGSLVYSEIYQLEPCLFCWWQRIFLYPQVVLFAVALYRHGRSSAAGYDIFHYSTPLAVIGSLLSLYHVFLQQGVIASTGACLQNGVSCTTIDISIFGFLTIPMMALILGIALSLLGLLVLTNKKNA
jgi:disulfide bond formation protein DsbB